MLYIYRQALAFLSICFLVILGFAIPLGPSIVAVLIVPTLFFFAFNNNLAEKYKLVLHNGVALAALALFALYLIGTILSHSSWPSTLAGLHKYAKLLLIPLLLPICTNSKCRRASINAFLIAIAFTILLAIDGWLKYLLMGGPSPTGGVFRNHIETGLMVAFAAFILAHKLFSTSSARSRILYLVALLVFCFYLFFLNISRTGYVVAGALFVLFFWQKFRLKGMVLILLVAPLLASSLYYFSTTFHSRVDVAIQDTRQYEHRDNIYTSIGDRLGFAHNSMQLIKKHPIMGTGTGSFLEEYKKHFALPPEFAHGLNDPHNEYLMTTVQLGLVGLFFLLLLFATQWKLSYQLPLFERYFAQGLVITFAVGSCCDAMLFLSTPGHMFVYFSAILYAALGNQSRIDRTFIYNA